MAPNSLSLRAEARSRSTILKGKTNFQLPWPLSPVSGVNAWGSKWGR